MKPEAIGIAPVLIVPDVEKTTAYYRDVLGFGIIGLVGKPAAYGMVERNGFQVHFGLSADGAFPRNESHRGDLPDFVLWVPEINAYFEEVAARGGEASAITLKPYGRTFMVRDCDGHRILIGD